ncbi:hypothetical protein AAVH_20058 [Aphelenchoides avenae]|nr:hypothetical protein AAVH_20058 [Aphelenchus avenae]
MDQQFHDTSSFEYAFSIAQQRHKDTASELHRLREELRARDGVVKQLRARLGDRFDAELECRLIKDQLKKLQEGMRQVGGEDGTPLTIEAMSGESSATAASIQAPAQKNKNCVAKLPLEYLADILSFLDRFSLDDRIEFSCPKLYAAVATLDGQNLRSLDSLRLDITRSNRDDWRPGPFNRGGDRGVHARDGLGAAAQKYMTAHAETPFTIVVECSSLPTALKHGATRTAAKLSWNFVGTPKATPHFVGLLRNAFVQQLRLSGPLMHHFIQALSAADVDVAVGSMTVDRVVPEVVNLPIAREALMQFNRLETLEISDAPVNLLSDHFLIAATQKRVMCIELTSARFYAYPELCDGALAFLFRTDLDESAKVELRFPAARVPQDFCLRLMEHAISVGKRYSIDASFLAVHEVDEQLVGFEEYRRLDDNDDHCVVYQVPDPSVTDVTVELKITAVNATVESDGWTARTPWKLIDFRRYRKSDVLRSLND